MDEVLKDECKAVQNLICEYFTVETWNALAEGLRRRYLQISRNYINVPDDWEVNPMPKPDFMMQNNNNESPTNKDDTNFFNDNVSNKTRKRKKKEPESKIERRYSKRNIPSKNYYEEEEPDSDCYVYCDNCEREYIDFCEKCGMLIAIKDNPIPMGVEMRARKTVPRGILEIRPSSIHGLGVFASTTIQKGVRMGPYEGQVTRIDTSLGYAWKLRDGRLIDGSDETHSNYLRYVNCARNVAEQNLIGYQYQGQLYYRSLRDIQKGEELLVYYGSSFAKHLGINTKKYYEPAKEKTELNFFTCKYCHLGLSSSEFRDKHQLRCKFNPIRTKKSDNDDFLCKHCNFKFNSKDILDKHKGHCKTKLIEEPTSDAEVKFKCGYCAFSAERMEYLKNHMLTVHEKEYESLRKTNGYVKEHTTANKQFTCVQCHTFFDTQTLLDEHFLRTHPDKEDCVSSEIHCCCSCPYKTAIKRKLTRHKCNNYLDGRKTNLTMHLSKHGSGAKRFTCSECKKSFNLEKDLNNHILNNHKNNESLIKTISSKIYSCQHCNYQGINKTDIMRHLLTHGGEKPHSCLECKKSFCTKKQLDSHILNNHKNNESLIKTISSKIYSCQHCNYQSFIKTHIRRHLLTHGGEKPHSCLECKKSFCSKKQLDSHILNNHKNNESLIKTISSKIYSCQHCNYQSIFKTHIRRHLLTHGGEKPHSCLECKKSFCTKKQLDSHILNNHKNNESLIKTISSKIYSCQHCNYQGINKTDIMRHLLTHGGEKPHSCLECKKSFCTKKQLDSHILNNHKNNESLIKTISSKIYSCQHCNYQSFIKTHIRRHLLTHGGEKPHSCLECKKSFCSKKQLDSHILNNHKNNESLIKTISSKIYSCQHCNYQSFIKTHIRRHLLTHGGEKPHSCLECKKSFCTKKQLDNHILNNHKNNESLIKTISSKIYTCGICNYQSFEKNNFKRHLQTHLK